MNETSSQSCSRCLMGLFGTLCEIVSRRPDLCRECVAYEANPLDFRALKHQLQEVVHDACLRYGHVLLAYSGGLDSTVAIKLLVSKYHVRPILFHIDNGFRTEKVWCNLFRVSDYFGLKLQVYSRPLVELIKREYPPGTIFCGQDCTNRWRLPAFQEVCTQNRSAYCFTGNEAIRENNVVRGSNPACVSTLAAHPMTQQARRAYIAELPWEDPEISGYDTDCIYAGWAITEYYRHHGTWPPIVLDYLSRRIRLGLCDREAELTRLLAGPTVSREQLTAVEALLR